MARFLLACMGALLALGANAHADTVLITGANRGIGLEMTRQYAARGYTVIATARNPADAKELAALSTTNKKIAIEKLDVTDSANVKELARKYRGKPIDILINNAGILGDIPKQTVGAFDGKEFLRIMETNVLGAMLVTEAFRDNVVTSSQKKIIGVSSGASRISTGGGGYPFYSVSKAALNRGLRALGAEIGNGVLVGILMLGPVDTEMLAATAMAGKGTPIDTSVEKMIAAIEGLTLETAAKPLTLNGRPSDW